jgi:hypothetical protein
MTFSGFCFADLRIATQLQDDVFYDESEKDGLIGWQFFKGCKIIVDWKNNLILVKKESPNE